MKCFYYFICVPIKTAALPTTPPLDANPTKTILLLLQSPETITNPSGLGFIIYQVEPLKCTVPSGPIPYILLLLVPFTLVKKYPVEVS